MRNMPGRLVGLQGLGWTGLAAGLQSWLMWNVVISHVILRNS